MNFKFEQDYIYQYPIPITIASFGFFLFISIVICLITMVSSKSVETKEELEKLNSKMLISIITTFFLCFFLAFWLLSLPKTHLMATEKVSYTEGLINLSTVEGKSGSVIKYKDAKDENNYFIKSSHEGSYSIPEKNVSVQYIAKTKNPKIKVIKTEYKNKLFKVLFPEYINEDTYKYTLYIHKKSILKK